MNKQNYNEEHTLDTATNKVKVTITYELDRYDPQIYGGCQEICEETVKEIQEVSKIWTSQKGDYAGLTNVKLDPDEVFTGKTLTEDLEKYQQYLDKTFGKDEYEAFVLGAYIHSGTSFSVNKSGNHVCRWDSSQLGFIGLKKNVEDIYSAKHPDKVAEMLTAAWEGEFLEYQVVDNLTNDVVDSIVTADYKEAQDWCAKAEEKYHVSFDGINPVY